MALKLSETERAILRQPAILAQDWNKQFTSEVQQQLRGVNHLVFIGTGSSYHCALWSYWLCLETARGQIESRAVTSWDFLADDSLERLAKKRDTLFIVISHRGNRNLTKLVLDKLKKNKRILISGEEADVQGHPHLFTSPQEISNAHTMSLMGAMSATSEIIARLLPKDSAHHLRRQRLLTSDLLAKQILKFAHKPIPTEISPAHLRDLHRKNAVLRVVGSGPFQAIAMEVSLKAQEIGRIAAFANDTESMMHGPLTSVNKTDLIIYFTHTAGSIPAQFQANKFLYAERGEAFCKSVDSLGARLIGVKSSPKLASSWQAILDLHWGQALCLAYSKRWKINPDDNRCDKKTWHGQYK